MTSDERHEDWADPTTTDREYESDYVCTNPECEGYRVSMSLRCYRDVHGQGWLVDDRDLDCGFCGAQRVEVESLGVEQVSPVIVKRYQEVAA
ncbi:MAG: hypothetical protein ACRDK4_05105 [Solirubrobacteraceae bacterium]